MAWTLDTTTQGTYGSGNPNTVSHTNSANATLLVVVLFVNGTTARTGGAPTYAGQALTDSGQGFVFDTGGEAGVEIWYKLDPATGTNTVSVPNTGAVSFDISVMSFETTGNATFDNSNSATGTSATISLSLTVSSSANLIVGGVGSGDRDVPSAGTGESYNLVHTYDAGNQVWGSEYVLSNSGSPVTVDFTPARADDWGLIGLSFFEVSTTPASDNQPAYIHGGDTASDNQIAYVAGSLDTLDSQPAYISGGINVSDNKSAFVQGQDTTSDNQPAYIAGGLQASDSQPAYLAGGVNTSDNQPAYISGSVGTAVWRWYSDAATDGGMSALANENIAPTLTAAQMHDTPVRLRVHLSDVDTGTVDVQYSYNQTNWMTAPNLVPGPTANEYGRHVFWAAGAGIDGNTIGTQLLTGTTTSGKYHTDDDVSETVSASQLVEVDLALAFHYPPPDSTIYLRVVFNGSPITIGTPISVTTSSAANRGNTIGFMPPNTDGSQNRSVHFSSWNRAFHDGTRWWVFKGEKDGSATIEYYNWTGTGAWSAKATKDFGQTTNAENINSAFKVISGTPVVFVFSNSGTPRWLRGEISGTTVTWDTEDNLGVSQYGTYAHCSIDDGNYWWIGGIDGTTGVWAARATNADTGTSWTSGFQTRKTVADTGVGTADVFTIIGLSSDKALCIWGNTNSLKWATVTDAGGFSSVGTLKATAHQDDWGVVRAGGNVYAVGTDSTTPGGNWWLEVFSESGGSWTSGPAPSISGSPTDNDGIALVYDEQHDRLLAFGTFRGYGPDDDRIINYKVYSGPGAAGSWSSTLFQLNPWGIGNSDEINVAPLAVDGKFLLLSSEGDADLTGQYYSLAYYYRDTAEPATFTGGVAASADDAEENSTDDSVSITSGDLEMNYDATGGAFLQTIGIRFPSVTVPKDAIITHAYVTFICQTGTSGDLALPNIYGELASDSAQFVASSQNITGRTYTTARAYWRLTGNWTSTQAYYTVDLAEIIQEIVNQAGWSSGNALSIIIPYWQGTAQRIAESYDGAPASAPDIYIEYIPVAASDNQSAYIEGAAAGTDTSDNKSAYIAGSVNVSDSQPAYIAGGVNVSDNQAAYMAGSQAASSRQAGYVEGLYQPLPVTEPWTGSNDDPWRISHWVTDIVE